MESVNELLRLFMRQVRRERVMPRPCAAGSIDVQATLRAPPSKRRRGSELSKDDVDGRGTRT